MRFQIECLQKSSQWTAAEKVQRKISNAGFSARLAGGAVRDAFLGVVPHDLDLVTEASIDDLKKIFSQVILVGENFGVLRVQEDGQIIEVAQYREESDYADGRRPSLVKSATPEKDAQRRDFTVNALFYDFSTGQVLDYVGGVEDLQKRQLRCVGNPRVRFQEDHLRILRALRFEAQLGFELEEKTAQACRDLADLTLKVSRERIQDELMKILLGPRPARGIEALHQFGLLYRLFPARENSYQNSENDLKKLFVNRFEDPDLALSSFLWKVEKPEDVFRDLRWSKKSEKKIISTLKVFLLWEDFLKKRRGEQLKIYQEKFFRDFLFGVQDFKIKKTLIKDDIHEVQLHWEKIKIHDSLPEPLVKSSDLIVNFQGASLGEKLEEAFYLQLEKPAISKDEILDTIRKPQ